MKKRGIAILLALLMLLACTPAVQPAETTPTEAPAAQVEQPTQAPAAEQEQPAEQPAEAPAEPASDEYQLPREDGCNQLSIYWTSKSLDIATSDMWIWFKDRDGRGYPMYECAYGAKCVINVPEDVTEVGFIVRTGCSDPGGTAWGTATKAYDGDRFIEMTGGDVAVYLRGNEAEIYFSEDGGVTLYQKLSFQFAGIVDEKEIKYRVEPAATLTDLSMVKVYRDGEPVEVASVSSLNNTVVTGQIKLSEPVDIAAKYEVEIQGYGRKVAVPTSIFDSTAFKAQFLYNGDDLGATIGEDGTTFKVWAPTASKVVLNLFEAGDGGSAYETLDMERGLQGVWSITASCGHGTYYTYTVTTAVGTQEAVDPYAKAVGLNGNRGMVIDLDSTDPEGFADESFNVGLTSYQDAIIWEVHVRDFSNKIESSQYKGKYLALTETGLTNSSGQSVGIDYLKQLGVTHIHFQPIYDYATVDESTSTVFNWGYDPKNYNAPEGSYSTDPYHGEVRVNELKQAIQALHENGLAVVMDVVYNHTYDGNSSLNKIVPYYYYRYTATGENANGSGCGNETASDRYMFRKYMVDSVTYWQKEYHIDGFRFDLMALHDIDTMQAIEEAVHAINPQAILYGEGWTGGTTPLSDKQQASLANIRKVTASEGAIGSVAVFNDAIRDGLKGSVWEAKAKGYISGAANKSNGNKVLFGMTGGTKSSAVSWRVENAMIVNYMSAHDNRTLWDILKNADETADDATLLAQNRLGASLVLMSKGIPFWLAGEEMLRTKQGDENSYKSSDAVNNIDWESLTPDSDALEMVAFYRDLIALRKANTWLYTSDVTGEVLDDGSLAITYTVDEKAIGYAVANPTNEPLTVKLPDGAWQGLWSVEGQLSGEMTVPPMSVALVKAN